MAQLAEFESALKEVVNAKRLSASKMNNLTDIALKSMSDDTQLVSILYRTHKSLAPPAKVSSLYVFDALARAARTQVVKQGLTGEIHARPGNCATFLLKLEGILEGLVQDMISTATSEGKEKTKKVLDIWVKGSTFPAPILARLKEVAAEKDNEVKVTLDPRAAAVAVAAPQPQVAPQVPSAPLPPPAPVLDPQATLLALLTQAAANNAAQANLGQTVPNAAANPPQLALLQQLGANLGNPVPQQHFSPSLSPPQENNYARRHDDQRFDHDGRGNYRGGFNGRGRGAGRGWDEREQRDRFRDNSPPERRQRRSRSRSPARGGDRRNGRPYSPPRRPSSNTFNDPRTIAPKPAPVVQAGKDEFGRDIRPASPSPEPPDDIVDVVVPAQPPVAAAANANVTSPPAPFASNHESQMSLPPSVDANTSSRPAAAVPSKASAGGGGQQQGDLASFDLTTFNFTSPASWEALGKIWQASVGTAPTMEELMQFVMSGGMAAGGGQQQTQPPAQQQWSGHGGHSSWRGQQQQGYNRGGGRGRGGFSRGRGGYGGGGDWQDNSGTDAIVLGGGDDSEYTDAGPTQQVTEGSGAAGGGKMQRVGEKWVFVRDSVTT
ncbi:hypothetical protein C8F01DRAFT_1123607 [Mycena amicta]|nr:hypothetical protein C8F01DRAFT_1123607 [Mycena amicta]